MDVEELTEQLRYRVVGLLHVNLVGPGDRLPSIRRTAAQLGADHRAVAEAYRRLAEDGLVEVRPASGVYVAGAAEVEAGIAAATTRWLAGVFLEGWRRRLTRTMAGDWLDRCGRVRFRCACLETVEDHMVALSDELERDLELEVDRVYLGGPDDEAIDRLRRCDLAVALQFESVEATRLAAAAGVPLVLATVNPELAAAVAEILSSARSVVGVVADPRMADRAERYLGVTAHGRRIRYVAADRIESLEAAAGDGEQVLATLAARRMLGAEEYHLVPRPPTLLSDESVLEILGALVRKALSHPSTGGRD